MKYEEDGRIILRWISRKLDVGMQVFGGEA
jgi:hypothetical protein